VRLWSVLSATSAVEILGEILGVANENERKLTRGYIVVWFDVNVVGDLEVINRL